MTIDDWLMVSLGFLGSFGHCLGMCGPLSTALLLSDPKDLNDLKDAGDRKPNPLSRLLPVILLNTGRLISYGLVGGLMGGVGSVLVAGGGWVGLGSPLRQGIAIVTGLLLVGFGLAAMGDRGLPSHPLAARLHEQINRWMGRWVMASPLVLGLLWGMMPCGFLYVAQLKAAETLNPVAGAITMVAFGCGTLPMMMGIGALAAHFSHDRRSQLFRMGGAVTIAIGVLTIFRSSEMVDFTGHASIGCWMLALVARPIAKVLPLLLVYRRGLGVSAGLLAVMHVVHMLSHSLNWNLGAVTFLSRSQQWGFLLGFSALLLVIPPLCTSFDQAVRFLGVQQWRKIHLLSLPGLFLALMHTLLLGSNYLGNPELTPQQWNHTLVLLMTSLIVIAIRSSMIWKWFGQEARYNGVEAVIKNS
jgi:uncharacterized protein